MKHNLILRVLAKLLIPVIVLFAFYVQFHGDFGPGGGFQAGVIFSVAFILYAIVYGLDTAERVMPAGVLRVLASLGVLIYAGTGILTLLQGGNFLDYSVLAENTIAGQHIGILFFDGKSVWSIGNLCQKQDIFPIFHLQSTKRSDCDRSRYTIMLCAFHDYMQKSQIRWITLVESAADDRIYFILVIRIKTKAFPSCWSAIRPAQSSCHHKTVVVS